MEAIDQERKRTINDIKNQVRFVSERTFRLSFQLLTLFQMQSSGGNNQMRQLQTEIERLKTDLRNFKIAINDIKITNKNVVQDVSGINRLIQNMRTRISSHGYINSLLA